MKKNLIIVALALTLSVGIATSVYAASDTVSGASRDLNGTLVSKEKGIRFFKNNGFVFEKEGGLYKVLTENFGITKKDLEEAAQEGSAISKVLKEKGVNIDDVKEALIENNNKAIEEAVANGKISTEQGDKIKVQMKKKIEENNFDNVKTYKENKENRVNLKIMGKGNIQEILTEKLGITIDELKSALEHGNTISGLLGEKGVSLEQIKEAVVAGKITEEQGAEMKIHLEEKMGDINIDEMFKDEKIKGEKRTNNDETKEGKGTTEIEAATGI